MRGKVAAISAALVLGAVLLLGVFGWLAPADNVLRDARAGLVEREPSGTIVFADIDGQTLEQVGVWPWPRRVHAEIIDALMELGAHEVVLDIDFSAASNEADDAALEAALERAGGFARLAAFRQLQGEGAASYNLPLERFRRVADPVVVNVGIDSFGVVRTYPISSVLGGVAYPSLAAALAGWSGPAESEFIIDYSIRPDAISRVSVARLLEGRVAAADIEGKRVIVGASALELRDTFAVPGAGAVPGGIVQAIATETLIQKRALQPLGAMAPLLLLSLFGVGAALLQRWVGLRTVIATALALSLLTELIALALQSNYALLLDTAVVQLALFASALGALGREVGLKRFLHLKVSHERDAMRSILDRVIADNFDGVVVVEASGRIVAASRLAEELLGAGLTGQPAKSLLPPPVYRAIQRALADAGSAAQSSPAELLLSQPGGAGRIIEYSITRSEVTELGSRNLETTSRVACLTFRDVTERRHSEQRLSYLVSHDGLTGAWSRHKLVEMIDAIMKDDRTRARGVSVVLIDLRRFKAVNDTLGHGYGDMVLKQVVARLKVLDVEAVARLGGDSFALARPGQLEPAQLTAFCATVIARLTETYHLANGHQAIIAASAGATTSRVSGYDAEVLLSHADMALSAAKRKPGSNFALFSPEMDQRLKEKQDMEVALRRAIANNELTLTYQPQVELETGELVGVEALVRWHHPELGVVSPLRFVAAAEETGQIVELGRFVLRSACREAMMWPEKIRLAVNVSPIQFELTDVAGEVEQALEISGLAPSRLDIEITEGLFMSRDEGVTATLERLRAIGIGIALDDFGTGYSSLSYLGRLPVDKIKIDQSFVRSLPGNQESGAIIRAVMTLCETLNKVVIAEGIENADQAWMLRVLGCRLGQGYHFGRPKTAAELAELLDGQSHDTTDVLAG